MFGGMFGFLSGKSAEEKLEQAIKKSRETFSHAVSSGAFSEGSNDVLRLGCFLIEQLHELLGDTDINEKIKQHDLIVAGIIAIVLTMNFDKYHDPITPFRFSDLHAGKNFTLDTDFLQSKEQSKDAEGKAFEYVVHVGKKILIEKKYPLLEFDGMSGTHSRFNRSVNSLLINGYPDVKRHKCAKLYDYHGQVSADWVNGISLDNRIRLREQEINAKQAPASLTRR